MTDELIITGGNVSITICVEGGVLAMPKATRDHLFGLVDDLRAALEERNSATPVTDINRLRLAASPEESRERIVEEAPSNYVSWGKVADRLADGIIDEFRVWKDEDKADAVRLEAMKRFSTLNCVLGETVDGSTVIVATLAS